MLETIRRVTRFGKKVGNFCINPWCLHSVRDSKCSCCRKGCGSKSKKR